MIYIVDRSIALYDELVSKVQNVRMTLTRECIMDGYMLINADNCPDLDPQGKFGIVLLSCDTERLCDRYAEGTEEIFTSIDDVCRRLTKKSVWESEYFMQMRSRADVLLHHIGMNDKLCGFSYISFMTAYLTFVPEASIKYDIMPVMCGFFSKRAQNIERDMRYATDITWTNGNIAAQQKLFGYSINPERGKPVIRELVCMLSEILREQTDISEKMINGKEAEI